MNELYEITIYTDGACLGNPGPGGFGVVILDKDIRKELATGYRRTTNNRMEIMAAIAGLESLKKPSRVTLYSDSEYLVKAMTLGWAKRWQAQNWMRNKKESAVNPDLWERLLRICGTHQVEFRWVRGHHSSAGNNRCDKLATEAAASRNLLVDEAYEKPSRDNGARLL